MILYAGSCLLVAEAPSSKEIGGCGAYAAKLCSFGFAVSGFDLSPAAVRLAKGELSELVPTGLAGRGIVVYVEDRQPGDAVAASSQTREMLSRSQAGLAVQSWNESNMARLGVQPADWTSMKEQKDEDGGDADDGEGSQD